VAVIGSASIKIVALTREMKRDITRDINDALRSIKVDFDPVSAEARRLRSSLADAGNESRGLANTLRVLGGAMDVAQGSGRLLTGVLRGLAAASAASLASMAVFAGGGGLVAVGGALAAVAGAALLVPAALGAASVAVGTLVVGFQGMGEAFKNLGDPAKFAEAIAELSPQAREFALAVQELVPAFKELRLQVQERMFAGLAQEFAELANIYLPLVQAGLSAMADSLNSNALAFAAFARDRQTVADLATLFDNSALSVGILAGAVQPLLGALRDIGVVGSTFLPGLAEALAAASVRFGEFIAQARESGQLQGWIQGGITAFGDLFAIVGNVGSVLASVFRAGQDAGVGLLATLRDITGQLAAFASSAEGQRALGGFLDAAAQAAHALLPIIGALASVIGNQLAPILASIATTVGPAVTSVIAALGAALEGARPGITLLAQGFATFLTAIAGALPAVGQLVGVLGGALGAVLSAIGPMIAELATVLAGSLGAAIPLLVPGIVAIAGALGQVLEAVAPLLPPLAELAGMILLQLADVIVALLPAFEMLVEVTGAVLEGFGPVVELIGVALVETLERLMPLWPELSAVVAQTLPVMLELALSMAPMLEILPPLAEMIVALTIVLTKLAVEVTIPVMQLITLIMNLLVPAIVDWVVTTANGITAVINWFAHLDTTTRAILGGVRDFFVGIWNALYGVASNRVQEMVNAVRGALGAIGGVFYWAFSAASSAVYHAFGSIRQAVSDGINTVVSWMGALPGRIAGAIGDLGRILYNAGVRLITGLLEGIKSAAQNVYNFVSTIGPRIASLKGPPEVDRKLLVPAGLAIMAGLHDSLRAGFAEVEQFMGSAAGAMSAGFAGALTVPGINSIRLPEPTLALAAPTATPGGTEDLPGAILSALSGWQVVVSAREATSRVNRINKDNATR
jgi:phage-related protein